MGRLILIVKTTTDNIINLKNNYQSLIEQLFNGEKAITIFVVKDEHYYVIDDKNNFCVDVRNDRQNYIKQGIMDASLYDEALKQFRDGIPVLTEDNFQDYITNNNIPVYSSKWMKDFFTSGYAQKQLISFYDYIQKFLSVLNEPVSSKWDELRLRIIAYVL